jgi:hypothetical protein
VSFEGPHTQREFGNWLFTDEHKGYTAISHNGRGYDNYFLMDYLIQNSIIPTVIYAGAKIMYLK